MEYKRFENKIILRMDKGEEILSVLKDVCLKENVKLASISAIGAVSHFKIGVYDVEDKKYVSNEYKGVYEIVSLLGNISTMNGEFYSHLHMACASFDGLVYGGHLNSATISATVEMIIDIIDGIVDRRLDSTIGLNILDFNKYDFD